MIFKNYVDRQKNIIEDLINKYKNIKKNNIKGNIFMCSIIYLIFCFFGNYLDIFIPGNKHNNFLIIFLFSILILIIFHLMFQSCSNIFKSYRIEESLLYNFYNLKQKKEIQKIYKNLNKKTKKSLDLSVNISNSIDVEVFLYYFISDYIIDNSVLNEYKEIINYINENYHDSKKEVLIINVIEKIKQEDPSYFLNNKDKISEYIYNSKLSHSLKKQTLLKIKNMNEEKIKEEIDAIYKDIQKNNKNINMKIKLLQQL